MADYGLGAYLRRPSVINNADEAASQSAASCPLIAARHAHSNGAAQLAGSGARQIGKSQSSAGDFGK